MHKTLAILCLFALTACGSQKSAPIALHDSGAPQAITPSAYPDENVPFKPVFGSVKQSQPAPIKEMTIEELTPPKKEPHSELEQGDSKLIAGVPIPHFKPEAMPVAAILQENDGFKPFTVHSKVGRQGKFIWPVNGEVISRFGAKSGGLYNDGVNIAAPEGAPIHASMDGTVVYAGNDLAGYGNLLILRHKNGWLTAYAHTKEILVKKGDKVKLGQVVASVGQTGNVQTPQIHFAIRDGKKPLDPVLKVRG